MATRMQQRRGTAAQWISTNNGNGPILAPGELGIEIDTNKFKIGDGINHWVNLNYFTDAQSAVDAISNLVDGAPDLLNTLNEIAAALGDDPAFFTTVATNLSNHESDTTNIHGIANTADLATKTYVDDSISAFDALPSQTGNDGKFLQTTGSTTQWATVDLSTKQDVVSGVSSTEIGYLANVTSDIQGQLDDKLASADLAEAAQDAVNTAIVAGTGLDKTYDDNLNTITIDIDSTVATKIYADGKASDAQTAAEGYADSLASNYDAAGTATSAVSAHNSDTTSVHGISDTAELATKTFAAELLTNATKTNITITGDKNGLTITAENGVADSTTSDLTEGTNLYFTDERAQDAVGNSVGTGLSYDDASGAISVNTNTIATQQYVDDLVSNSTVDQSALAGIGIDWSGTQFDIDSTVATLDDTQTLTNKTISYTDNTITVQVANVSDLTATASELNTLDGITASTSELNILDGATVTASELNILDGATLSTTELNYVDGVTSAIQDQLDDKMPLAGGTFLGTVYGTALELSGDLTVNGTFNSIPTETMTVTNPMIYMGESNPANILDLGFVASHTINSTYSHTGLVKDATDGKWKLFTGVTDEPTTTINFAQATLDTLAVGTVEGSLTGNADTATALETARNIAGHSFDGTADISIAPTDLTGVTATASEINILDGATLTTTELNYVDGVTSAIQTQLDAKAIYPTQTNNAHKVLTTDGSSTSWGPKMDQVTLPGAFGPNLFIGTSRPATW